MSDSLTTKKNLASSMKKLMNDTPFSNISVVDICEECNINRKTFYYHFKDKYDLVNWIFDMEFIEVAKNNAHKSTWDIYALLLEYFYDNRTFYRKALSIEGQNSFKDHFKDMLMILYRKKLTEQMDMSEEKNEFQATFFADAMVCATERWLLDKNCMPPQKLVEMLKLCIQTVSQTFENDKEAR